MLALRNIEPGNGARILLKLDCENPTGSMKDRMALAMIEAAEADGRLAAGGAVVEYTGGSTGVSLSLVCAVKGYPLRIVTSDAFAREKLDHMKIANASELADIVPDGGAVQEREVHRDDPRELAAYPEREAGDTQDVLVGGKPFPRLDHREADEEALGLDVAE